MTSTIRAGTVSFPASTPIEIPAGHTLTTGPDVVLIKLDNHLKRVRITRRTTDRSTDLFITVNKSTTVVVE